jgi:hypothetical protein
MLDHAYAEVTLNVHSELLNADLGEVATRLDHAASRSSVSDSGSGRKRWRPAFRKTPDRGP